MQLGSRTYASNAGCNQPKHAILSVIVSSVRDADPRWVGKKHRAACSASLPSLPLHLAFIYSYCKIVSLAAVCRLHLQYGSVRTLDAARASGEASQYQILGWENPCDRCVCMGWPKCSHCVTFCAYTVVTGLYECVTCFMSEKTKQWV